MWVPDAAGFCPLFVLGMRPPVEGAGHAGRMLQVLNQLHTG